MDDFVQFPQYQPPIQQQHEPRPKLLKPETIHKPLFSLMRQMMKRSKNTRLHQRKRVKIV